MPYYSMEVIYPKEGSSLLCGHTETITVMYTRPVSYLDLEIYKIDNGATLVSIERINFKEQLNSQEYLYSCDLEIPNYLGKYEFKFSAPGAGGIVEYVYVTVTPVKIIYPEDGMLFYNIKNNRLPIKVYVSADAYGTINDPMYIKAISDGMSELYTIYQDFDDYSEEDYMIYSTEISAFGPWNNIEEAFGKFTLNLIPEYDSSDIYDTVHITLSGSLRSVEFYDPENNQEFESGQDYFSITVLVDADTIYAIDRVDYTIYQDDTGAMIYDGDLLYAEEKINGKFAYTIGELTLPTVENDTTYTIIVRAIPADSSENYIQSSISIKVLPPPDTNAPIITDVNTEATMVNVGGVIRITFRTVDV